MYLFVRYTIIFFNMRLVTSTECIYSDEELNTLHDLDRVVIPTSEYTHVQHLNVSVRKHLSIISQLDGNNCIEMVEHYE